MIKEERKAGLKALAKMHPHAEHVGNLWRNPLDAKSTGIRWTKADIDMFREFQSQYRGRARTSHHRSKPSKTAKRSHHRSKPSKTAKRSKTSKLSSRSKRRV
jgi:hypothetical protein